MYGLGILFGEGPSRLRATSATLLGNQGILGNPGNLENLRNVNQGSTSLVAVCKMLSWSCFLYMFKVLKDLWNN